MWGDGSDGESPRPLPQSVGADGRTGFGPDPVDSAIEELMMDRPKGRVAMRRSGAFLVVGLLAGVLIGGIAGVAVGASSAPRMEAAPATGGQPQLVLAGEVQTLTGGPTPAGVMADLTYIDKLLTKLIADWKAGDLHRGDLIRRATEIANAKRAMVKEFFNGPTYGTVTWSEVFNKLDCLDTQLYLAYGFDVTNNPSTLDRFTAAQKCKQTLETELGKAAAAQNVTIAEDDTWAHNAAIGKSNICINVRTTPAQASVSGTITGPGSYSAHLDTRPLDPPGSIQITAPITVAGDYTKTLIVYDATGKQTATVTKTFTVAAPPQDGPATTPACPKPTG
jgi:hypothetical protein